MVPTSSLATHAPKEPSGVTYTLDQERVGALEDLDKASFRLIHLKVFLVAGAGFFTDAYDTFAINIASLMLGYVYGTDLTSDGQNVCTSRQLSPDQDLGLKVAAPVGTFVGQLLFGWLADKVGRKRMYGVELMIIITATFAQALAGPGGGGHGAVDIISVLAIWRFVMGIGIGGDYPLSAIISSEFSATRNRGRIMTAVFASQGTGTFVASLVAFIIVVAFRGQFISGEDICDPPAIDSMWRLLIGLGCVPGAVALYFRLTIPETPRFTMDIERNVQQASDDIHNILTTGKFAHDPDVIVQRAHAPRASWADFRRYFGKWENMKVLIGTSYSWFVLDMAFYGLGLNSSAILQLLRDNNVNFGVPTEMGYKLADFYSNLKSICAGNLVLSATLIPGYWVSFLFIDSWGRKPIQFMGFGVLAILFIAIGFSFDKLVQNGNKTEDVFMFLYCLANFFQNFGANTTTFIIPGEVFPTRYRSTAHGISAASGKFGAIISQIILAKLAGDGIPLREALGTFLKIFGFLMLTGIGSTLLLPETKGRTLEELSNEDMEGFFKGGLCQQFPGHALIT
ncbi:phosphate transporter [Infundibulicybe gibba]|nr:phosphate transporter [Infundibulicybe gibba]